MVVNFALVYLLRVICYSFCIKSNEILLKNIQDCITEDLFAHYFVIFSLWKKYYTLQAIYNYVYAYIVCLKKPSHGYLRLGLKMIKYKQLYVYMLWLILKQIENIEHATMKYAYLWEQIMCHNFSFVLEWILRIFFFLICLWGSYFAFWNLRISLNYHHQPFPLKIIWFCL